MNDAEVKLQVKIDSSEAEKAVKTLSDKTKELGSKFTNAGKALTVGLTLPITALIGAGIKYNTEIEQIATSFEVLTGSAEKATDIIARLKKIGSETPFEFTDLANATTLLMNFGFESDEAIKSMTMLGDIAQGDSEHLMSIARAYGKMNSAQKVSLEDINMMIDAGFNPLGEIAKNTGESMESLYDRISKGTISVDEITKSMKRSTSQGGKYFESMKKQSETTAGKLSTLTDAFNEASGELTLSLLPAITNIITEVTNLFSWFSSLDTGTQNFILGILVLTAAIGPLLIGIGSLTTALTVLSANPVVLIIAGIIAIIMGLVFTIWYLYNNWEAFTTGLFYLMRLLGDVIVNAFFWIINVVSGIWRGLGDFIVWIIRSAGDGIIWGLTQVGNFIRWVFSGIGDFVSWIFKGMVNTIFGVLNTLIWGLNFAISLVLIPVNALIGALNSIPGVYIPYVNFAIPYIPKLKTGTNYTQEGLHYLHEGEAVVPKKYNPALGGGMGQVVYVDMPDIYMDSNKVGKALTPSISRTLRLVGAR